MNKSALSNTDKDLIKKFMLGGAGVGVSAAALTSLLNHLNQLSAEAAPATHLDDDVLRVQVRDMQKKQASIGGSLAMTGGALSALGGYALIRKLYQDAKKRRMQEMLDAAQNQFIELSDVEAGAQKSASSDRKPMGLAEFLTSSPLALSLLLGLGSGVATHQFLRKTYPETQAPTRVGPRRLVLEDIPAGEETEVKTASMEMVGRLLCSGLVKSADSDFLDVIAACGQGRVAEVRDSLCEFSADTTLDLVKGAALDASPEDLSVGCTLAFGSPVISPLVASLAAAEYVECAPEWSKKASDVDQDSAGALIKLAAVANDVARGLTFESEDAMWSWFEDKQASMEAALDMARKVSEAEEKPEESDVVDNEAQDSDEDTAEDNAEDESDDIVDAVLSGTSGSDSYAAEDNDR